MTLSEAPMWDTAPMPGAMGDLFTYKTAHRILSIHVDEDDRQRLYVVWSDG